MFEENYSLECDYSLPYGDRQDFKNSYTNWDTNPTTYKVLGRKINSEAFLANNADNACKYPRPVQVTFCKPKKAAKRHLQDISNRPRSQNSKPRYKSKTPEPVKANISRPSEAKKNTIQRIIGKSTTGVSIAKSQVKKSKISIEIPQSIKENSVVKKNIDSIVLQTLKKQQKQKKQAEKSKIEEKERQKLVKKQLEELNKHTRLENYNRFKQEKFHPKCAWGTDERRITRVNDSRILKEAEELRKKKREERERSKSAGRGRIGLDVLKLKRESSKMQEEEIFPQKKISKERDKTILQFMRKQKKERQRSKELQKERARDDENKRLQQLMELEKITRKQPKRNRSSKMSRKLYSKKEEISIEDSCINYSEDEEVMGILHGVRSVTPDSYEIQPQINSFDYKQSGRECMVFGVFPESSSLEQNGNITQMVTDIVEKRVKHEESLPIASATMPMADVKSTYSIVNTEEEYKESSSSDISKRKSEIRKKLSELRNRVDRAKNAKSEDYDEVRNKAAIKIQALMRGALTRQALRRYFEEIDEQTPQDSEDYDWMFEKQYGDSGEASSNYEDFEVQKIQKQSYSHSEMMASKNNRSYEKSIKKQQDVEKILKAQVEWRDIQKSKLIMLKNKDLEEMKAIARKVGSEEILMKHFEEIIERRYAHINQLFDENIEAVKSAVQHAIEEDDAESLLHTLEKQENFASEIFQNLEDNEEMNELMKLKDKFDFKNIWNYSESEAQSVRISELELASNSHRTVEHSHRETLEFLPNNFIFFRIPSSIYIPCYDPEPIPAIDSSDIIETLMACINHELFIEALTEAWDIILTGSSFINDVAERILALLMLNESQNLQNFDLHSLRRQDTESTKSSINPEVPILHLMNIGIIGIDMNEDYVLKYIRKLFDYLNFIHFDIESVLNKSSSFSPLEMLSKMQEAEIGVMIEKSINIRVLPLNLYLDLEKETPNATQIQESQHIHNKMLFDVVNETLFNHSRKSDPMPWSFDKRNISQKSIQIESILGNIIEEIKDLNRVHAGRVPKIDYISNSEETEEDVIQQLKEEQVSCMLAMEIIAQEPLWINYEFEETQVRLDLADMTLEGIVEETIAILDSFAKI